jgi:fermentation-respiration switch protein FrsA (DUF1100 family)
LALRTTSKFFLLVFAALSLSACSNLLYYPAAQEFVDRKKMPIQPEDVEFASGDGTRLHGWYFKSILNAASTANCTILLFHGNAQNISTHFFTLYSAPSQGYDYFIFDYRGYGSSAGKPSPEGTVADGRAAIQWLHDRDPKKKIIVMGQSLGGAIALKAVQEMNGKVPIELLIADSTFTSYKSAARQVLAKGWLTWLFQPLGWLLLGDKFAPKQEMAKLASIPLVVIHGDADQVIDFSLGERLYREAPGPKEFWRVPNGRHTDFMWAEKGQFAERFYNRLDQVCAPQVK